MPAKEEVQFIKQIFKLLNIDVEISYSWFNLLKVHNMELSLRQGRAGWWGEENNNNIYWMGLFIWVTFYQCCDITFHLNYCWASGWGNSGADICADVGPVVTAGVTTDQSEASPGSSLTNQGPGEGHGWSCLLPSELRTDLYCSIMLSNVMFLLHSTDCQITPISDKLYHLQG